MGEPISPPEKREIELHDFYFPDYRANAPSSVHNLQLVVDRKKGDVLELDLIRRTARLQSSDGSITFVPPSWLWYETRVVVVEVKPRPPK